MARDGMHPTSTGGSPIPSDGVLPTTMKTRAAWWVAIAPADPPDPEGCSVAANDDGGADDLDPERLREVDAVILQRARRMAREDFAAHIAAHDSVPKQPDQETPSCCVISADVIRTRRG